MSASFENRILITGDTNKGKEFNEFARIQGLGHGMQRWLRDVFHVYTLADLSNLSVNRVFSQAEDEGKALSREQIETWITQAQTFAAEQTSWQTFATFVVSLQTRQIGGQTQQRTIAYFVEADRRKIWSGVECNGVYELMLDQLKHAFQLEPEVNVPMAPESRLESEPVDENQGGDGQAELEPVAALEEGNPEPAPEPAAERQSEPDLVAKPADVVVTPSDPEPHAAVPAKPTVSQGLLESTQAVALEPEANPEAAVAVTEPVTLEITQLTFWLPPKAETEPENAIVVNVARRSLPGTLYKGNPFELEVTFQISGAGAAALTREPLPYRAQCFIENRATREKIQLDHPSTGALAEGELTYTSRLSSVTLQQPGAYRLQVVTTLDGGRVGPGFFELPFVQVA